MPSILVSLHRTPFTLALNRVFRDAPRFATAHYGNVGLITLTQESATTHAEKRCRVVRHELHHTLDGEHTGIDKLKHRGQ